MVRGYIKKKLIQFVLAAWMRSHFLVGQEADKEIITKRLTRLDFFYQLILAFQKKLGERIVEGGGFRPFLLRTMSRC